MGLLAGPGVTSRFWGAGSERGRPLGLTVAARFPRRCGPWRGGLWRGRAWWGGAGPGRGCPSIVPCSCPVFWRPSGLAAALCPSSVAQTWLGEAELQWESSVIILRLRGLLSRSCVALQTVGGLSLCPQNSAWSVLSSSGSLGNGQYVCPLGVVYSIVLSCPKCVPRVAALCCLVGRAWPALESGSAAVRQLPQSYHGGEWQLRLWCVLW